MGLRPTNRDENPRARRRRIFNRLRWAFDRAAAFLGGFFAPRKVVFRPEIFDGVVRKLDRLF
jgi:hypothetical protein